MRGPKISVYEEQLTELEKEWKNIQTNIERSDRLQQDINDINAGLEQIQSRLMNVDKVASNYEFFYDLERQAGVAVDRFSLGLPYDGAGLPLGQDRLRHFETVSCEVVMKGSIQEILTFLDLLDRQQFIIRMDLLNVVKPTEAATGSGQLNARLRCHVLAAKNE